MKHIMKCLKCGNFTMKEECCKAKTSPVKPQKYSPGKFAAYRREAKREELKKKNLL